MEQATLLGHNALTAVVQYYTATMQALANDYNAVTKAHEEAVRDGVKLRQQLDSAGEEYSKALTDLAVARNETAEARTQLEAARVELVALQAQLEVMIGGGAEMQLRLDHDVPGIGKYGELVRVWMTPTPAKDEAEAPKPETMGEG